MEMNTQTASMDYLIASSKRVSEEFQLQVCCPVTQQLCPTSKILPSASKVNTVFQAKFYSHMYRSIKVHQISLS